ncbi:MAG: hypothetical protein ACRCZA_08420 [Shewanella sp.]|uniref:hypothetical protein n=1 Tax=Shewanella sp. TaxID=50422 RepID=UPI003F2B527D
MSRKIEVLETVTDSFNLKNHGRSDGNNRGYLIESVKKMLSSAHFKERLKLRELYGYFGHNRRQLSEKMDLNEVEVVYRDGKPVVLENVPAAITTDMSVNDDGIVTFTQDILKTPAGYAAKAMRDAGAGGWSWAVNGVRTLLGASAQTFHGFDYVKHPSYIDMDKQSMMLESVGVSDESMLMEKMLESAGFDCGQSAQIDHLWSKSNLDSNEVVYDLMMLESIIDEKEAKLATMAKANRFRATAMLEAVNKSPLVLTEAQKNALINLGTEEDLAIVTKLFEGLSTGKMDTLPIHVRQPLSAPASKKGLLSDDEYEASAVDFNYGAMRNSFK